MTDITNETAPIDEPTVENTAAAPEEASLQIADLIVIANLIQATAQRGAIRADEMELVGSVFTKLTKFLTAAGAINAQPAADAPTEAATND